MSNGKGSSRRKFNGKREEAFLAGHPKVYGDREKVDGRRTHLVVRDGKLVEKDQTRYGFIDVQPVVTYVELDRKLSSTFR